MLSLLLILSAAVFSLTDGKVVNAVIDADARSLIPITDAFGFANGGKLVMTISKVKVYKQHTEDADPDLNRMGFFLSPMEADAEMEEDVGTDANPVDCILTTLVKNSLPMFSNQKIGKVIYNSSDLATFEFTIENGGLSFLYFANCVENSPVSFDIHVEMYNFDSNGNKDYLSLGETELETVYWIMFSLFTTTTAVWCYYIYRERAHAFRIHYLMASLGCFKALTVLSQALTAHYIERTGYADGWNVAYYIFTFFRGILFFTVVVLIGTGWSYMKPFLGDREKRILMVVIPLQVFANIAIVIMEEESPSEKDWFTWRDVFHLVDIICCCAILFPIVWSIKHLREASQSDGKAARNLEKLTLFRQFYVMVVVYIYFTRIVVYLLKSTLPYQYEWASEAADQMATLAFYVWTAVSFRPHATNPYLRLQADDDIELPNHSGGK